MMTIIDVYTSVSTWNAARYPRVYDQDLQLSLLIEEQLEYFNADTSVDQLDALADICYVAMGGLWKLHLSPGLFAAAAEEASSQIGIFLEYGKMEPIYYISSLIDQVTWDASIEMPVAMHCLALAALCQMNGLGLTNDECMLTMQAVCKSNDSKTISKLDSQTKALGKGTYYQPPTLDLVRIIETVLERTNDEA